MRTPSAGVQGEFISSSATASSSASSVGVASTNSELGAEELNGRILGAAASKAAASSAELYVYPGMESDGGVAN